MKTKTFNEKLDDELKPYVCGNSLLELKQSIIDLICEDVIGRADATYHDHPFLSDYSMSKINITINDMMLYDKTQHFTNETREWFENTINNAINGQLQTKINNDIVDNLINIVRGE